MNLDNLVIRRAVDSDASSTVDAWLRSFTEAVPSICRAHSDQQVRAWLGDEIVPTRETWLATVENLVVGTTVLRGDELDQLYLDRLWRGRGIGDRLVGLALWTFQVNGPAQRFYQRHGFIAVERTDRCRTKNANRTSGTCGGLRPDGYQAGSAREDDLPTYLHIYLGRRHLERVLAQ